MNSGPLRWLDASCLTNKLTFGSGHHCTEFSGLSLKLFQTIGSFGYFLWPVSSLRSIPCLTVCVCVSACVLPSLPGDKWSAGVLGDPWFDQIGAFAIGSGSGGRWSMARPPAWAARRSQWPRDALRSHTTSRLWSLSGKRCDTNIELKFLG